MKEGVKPFNMHRKRQYSPIGIVGPAKINQEVHQHIYIRDETTIVVGKYKCGRPSLSLSAQLCILKIAKWKISCVYFWHLQEPKSDISF
jgi:hypothetical protein